MRSQAAARAVHRLPTVPWPDALAAWLAARIFNDRELYQGAFMVMLGLWVSLFPAMLSEAPWWAAVFRVLSPWIWAVLLGGMGGGRVFFSLHRRSRAVQATLAFLSCLLLAFMASIIGLVQWRMIAFPVFAYHAFQAGVSHLRLILNRRRS